MTSFGSSFVSHKGALSSDALSGKKLVGVYFSAHWCPPCRIFTPILAEFYEEVKNQGLEIIFGSRDSDEQSFGEYYGKMPWIAFQFSADIIENLMDTFDIEGIPALLIFKPKGDGNWELVTKNGRDDVEEDGPGAIDKWLSK